MPQKINRNIIATTVILIMLLALLVVFWISNNQNALNKETDYLIINNTYWISANPIGNGLFGLFAGVSEKRLSNNVDFSFIAGTQVTLLDTEDDLCKVEGKAHGRNIIIQGWVDCDRLLNFKPTMPPNELFIQAP